MRVKEKSARVFSIALENKPVEGCTISKAVSSDNGYYISYFSLAKDTDISAETYSYKKLLIVNSGKLNLGKNKTAESGEIFVTPIGVPTGTMSKKGSVYTEITLKEKTAMNKILKSGEVLALKNLLPYEDGKIVNMDLIHDEKLKFVVMSFSKGTSLPEHAAPGEALIFALDGEGVIGYEGKEYTIHAGENFKFDKGGAHYVKAVNSNFKMALLLTL